MILCALHVAMYGSAGPRRRCRVWRSRCARSVARIRFVTAAAAIFALATTGPAPRVAAGESLSADSHPESTLSEDGLERERRLLPTFDLLSELPGFQVGGLDPDPKVNGVFVYWNGEFGTEAQAAVEEANRNGIAVNVVSVPHSYDDLLKIAGPLIDALAKVGSQPQGFRIGDPFDEIAVWGSALDQSAEARRIAEESATGILPPDLRFAIVASPGMPVPYRAITMEDSRRPAVGT